MNELWEKWKRDNHNLYFVVGWVEVCDREGLELHADAIARELKISVDEVETLIDRARVVIAERNISHMIELQQTFDGKYYLRTPEEAEARLYKIGNAEAQRQFITSCLNNNIAEESIIDMLGVSEDAVYMCVAWMRYGIEGKKLLKN